MCPSCGPANKARTLKWTGVALYSVPMEGVSWTTVALALGVLALAAPYVNWIRHPAQRPFAAYLVFVSVFALACIVLFLALAWLAGVLGVRASLGPGGLAALLLALGVVPAFAIATWQARQPPSRRGRPPD